MSQDQVPKTENLSTSPLPRPHHPLNTLHPQSPSLLLPKLLPKSKPPLQQDSPSYWEAASHPWEGGVWLGPAPAPCNSTLASTPSSDVLENSPLPRPPGEGVHAMKWG